jgi:hypothetical protein
MYSINTNENIIISNIMVNINELLPHEEVVIDRLKALVEYLKTLKPYIIIPSVLVCYNSKMIVDGHHRVFALRELGHTKIPVTMIRYESNLIIPDLVGEITKQELIKGAISKKMFKPKTSFHHIIDSEGKPQPLILLSSLFRLNNM